ncbi:MAG TPA: M15 family metallopeptidase, partial [Acidimicrobiales bacterium]
YRGAGRTHKLAGEMKGWLVALALSAVVVAAGVGLWITWDSTQPAPADGISANADLLVTPPTTAPPSTTTTVPLPSCEPGSEPVIGDPESDWATAVVDTRHRMPEDFVPPDLVDVVEAGFETRDQVRALVVQDLAALRSAAEASGTPIVVVSGYRSFGYQRGLFEERVAQVGEEEAAANIARPGHSEHQLGTAVDVLGPEGGELSTAFGATPTGRWLQEHAHEFGFVISYPEGASGATCYDYEPWHLRYVGRDNATAIHESGLTPREWMHAQRTAGGR